jgi:hypothetical protein
MRSGSHPGAVFRPRTPNARGGQESAIDPRCRGGDPLAVPFHLRFRNQRPLGAALHKPSLPGIQPENPTGAARIQQSRTHTSAQLPTPHHLEGCPELPKPRPFRIPSLDIRPAAQRSYMDSSWSPDNPIRIIAALNHPSVCTSTESTAGKSRTIGFQLSPASAEAYTCPPLVPKYTPHLSSESTAMASRNTLT